MRRLIVGLSLVAMAAATAACSSGPAAAPTTTTTTVSPVASSTTEAPQPAGAIPSQLSKMPCEPKAQGEIAETLGVNVAKPVVGTWANHLYSCPYIYSNGTMVLSVKELSSWAETDAYFNSFKATLGDVGSLSGLGQGAYQTRNGSVVVRKDWKVLLVDVKGLPHQFAVPPTTPDNIAITVADLILGCWAGDLPV